MFLIAEESVFLSSYFNMTASRRNVTFTLSAMGLVNMTRFIHSFLHAQFTIPLDVVASTMQSFESCASYFAKK